LPVIRVGEVPGSNPGAPMKLAADEREQCAPRAS